MSRPKVGVMHMSSGSGGWQEKYYFAEAATYTAALAAMKNIVWGRSAFFASNVVCVFARVSTVGPVPDRYPVQMRYPVGPHPSWTGGTGVGDTNTPTNDDSTAAQMAFQGAMGQWANRYYRAMPDSWVIQKRLLEAIFPYYTPSDDTSIVTDLSPAASGLNHLQICQRFWRLLQQTTLMGKKVSAINYTLTEVADTIFMQITSKKTGRVFRQSRGRRPTTLIT